MSTLDGFSEAVSHHLVEEKWVWVGVEEGGESKKRSWEKKEMSKKEMRGLPFESGST